MFYGKLPYLNLWYKLFPTTCTIYKSQFKEKVVSKYIAKSATKISITGYPTRKILVILEAKKIFQLYKFNAYCEYRYYLKQSLIFLLANNSFFCFTTRWKIAPTMFINVDNNNCNFLSYNSQI